MSRLQLGGLVIDVAVDDDVLPGFVDRICRPETRDGATHRVAVRGGGAAALVIDEQRRAVTLTLAAGAGGPVAQIGVLQALARAVAYLERSTGTVVLLHGSALTLPCGAAVAVLDGGLGQGKTSLAIGLARSCGRLLVDEFTFAQVTADGVVLAAAPSLPWHVRTDMAAYLLPPSLAGPLLHPDELLPVAETARKAAPLRLILVPDVTLRAGRTVPVPAGRAPRLLHHAVGDHLRKLADPRLDHVSIFAAAGQVTDAAGRRLLDQHISVSGQELLLRRLARIPVYRVGIGGPADLAASVTAAGRAIETSQP